VKSPETAWRNHKFRPPVNASAKTLFHSNFFIILFLLFDVSFKYRINLWVGLYLLFHTMSIGKQ
jgi:hypothetical protein